MSPRIRYITLAYVVRPVGTMGFLVAGTYSWNGLVFLGFVWALGTTRLASMVRCKCGTRLLEGRRAVFGFQILSCEALGIPRQCRVCGRAL